MALDTLDDLETAIATWLGRPSDVLITANVGDFVTMAEAYINRNLRVRQMETVSTFTTTNGSTNLPDDYLAWRRMTLLSDTYQTLEYLIPPIFERANPTLEEGTPVFFTIEGSNISIRPVDDDTSVEFLYFAKVPALSATNTSNWLLADNPDLYFAACMVEAQAFLMNADGASQWASKRDAIIDEMTRLSTKTQGPSAIVSVGTWY